MGSVRVGLCVYLDALYTITTKPHSLFPFLLEFNRLAPGALPTKAAAWALPKAGVLEPPRAGVLEPPWAGVLGPPWAGVLEPPRAEETALAMVESSAPSRH